MVTYGTTAIPSDQIDVIAGGTVSVSVAFDNTVGLIGGMDTSNGSANTGEVTQVSSPTDASSKFGEGSELHEAVELAFLNGAGTVWALPVEETSTNESVTGSGQLDEAPIMDPNVNTEHTITDNNGNDVHTSYDLDAETVSGTEAYVNPVTGETKGDSGTTYDFTYTHGDYSATAMEPLLDESPRIVVALTENTSVINTLATELNSRATDFDFMHGVAGAHPTVDPPSYSNTVDERRISMAYPSRGYRESGDTNEARIAAAIGGYLAGLALGLSSTNDSIGGFQTLRSPLAGPSEAGTMRDEGAMPLLNYPPVTIAIDMTTSSEPKFERVYAMQVIDEATEVSHQISRVFVGEQNTVANRDSLRRSHRNAYLGMENDSPQLLDDFTVTVQENDSDENQTDVEIGLDVVDVMDTVDVTMTVGDIIRRENVA